MKPMFNICRTCLLVMSIVNVFVALGVIGGSIYLYIDKSDLLTYVFQMNLARPACILLLAAGCTTFFLALLGGLAAGLQSRFLLVIYGVLAVLVACAALVGAICSISAKTQYTDYLRERMRLAVVNQYGVNVSTNAANAFVTAEWDRTQRQWYCCGIEDNSWGVYRASMWYELQPGNKEYDRPMVPTSCCTYNQYGNIIDQQKCQIWLDGPPRLQTSSVINEALIYRGCYTYGASLLQRVSSGIIAMGLILFAVMAFCLLLALGMYLGLRTMYAKPAVIRQTAYGVTKPNPSYMYSSNTDANGSLIREQH